VNAGQETSLLLFLTNLQPELDQHDTAIAWAISMQDAITNSHPKKKIDATVAVGH
jgi:hypothetical protein